MGILENSKRGIMLFLGIHSRFPGSSKVIDSVRVHLTQVQCTRACTLLENVAMQREVMPSLVGARNTLETSGDGTRKMEMVR